MSQDTISLTLEPRAVTGKQVKHLRRQGNVPAVIHDHGKDSVIVQGDYMTMLKVWQRAGKHHPVQLKADGHSYTALIKEAEFDPKKHQLTHLVFNAVKANEKVAAEVPIHAKYDEGNEVSPAERAGLMVLAHLTTVNVKALPKDLPDTLYYDAEKLVEVGDSISVADLVVPEGVEVETDPAQGIASVFEPSAVAAANDALGGEEDADAGQVPSEEGSPAEDEAPADQPGGSKADEPKTGENA